MKYNQYLNKIVIFKMSTLRKMKLSKIKKLFLLNKFILDA